MLFRMGVWGLVVWLAGTTASATPTRPSAKPSALDKPAFTATPAELLAVAKAAPAGDWPVVILREESDTSIDDQARASRRWRRVFVVRTQAGVEWGSLSSSWNPFYQDKPVIRARVIAPDGSVAQLDPKLLSDAPQRSTSSAVFSDARVIEAPLPRLQLGAVVEEEVVTVDRQPIVPGSAVQIASFGNDVPVTSTRFVFSAPVARKARMYDARLPAAVKPRREIAAGRETWTYVAGPLPAQPALESFVPGDVVQRPYVGITISSWPQVARAYRKRVEQRLAEGPLALPAGLPKTPTLETVRALTAWLHREIRYTGIEFGEASNIPWPPAETVKRGFGDCKDKATLLVALLRQAGIRADLALLSTGPGADVTPELPGMGSFDHAIVRARVGGKDVWIDATEDLLPPGQLPARDQGRHALIIADDTKALVRTPKAAPADNLVREVRTFDLADNGPATRVREATTSHGAFGGWERAWIRDTRTDDVKKGLTTYADSEYVGTYAAHAATSPTDLATPFTVTIDVSAARRAYTDRGHVEVYLFPTDTLAKLPDVLTVDAESAEPRRMAFEWSFPHVYEIENRLVLPAGFSMPTPPSERTHPLGPARLVERHRVDGQTYVVTFRFESGKPRLSAAEVTAVRRAVTELSARGPTRYVIEHTAWSLAEHGKPREAVAEAQRLIKLAPKKALHQTQLAYVLIQAGMGEAARRAARKAVALEPKNADAHVMLAWVLRHDSFGREYGWDHDRAGAIAAYRKARTLDPKHAGAMSDLADLLERDARGEAFKRGADLAGAIEARRAAHAHEKTEEGAYALARTLYWGKRYKDAEAVLRELKPSDERDQLLIATIAAERPGAAIEAAGRMRAGQAKANLLAGAGGILMLARHYDAMRALYAQTDMMRAGTPQAAVFQSLRVHATTKDAPHDPRTAIFAMLALSADPDANVTRFWDKATRDDFLATLDPRSPEIAQTRALGAEIVTDLMRSGVKFDIEGPATGPWRVRFEFFGNKATAYVALDGKLAKVIGAQEAPSGVGRHALRLLAKRDDAGARRLLEWLAKDLPQSAAVELFEGGALPPDRDGLLLAAAALGIGGDPARTAPVLTRCQASARDARGICDASLALTYTAAKKWAELVVHGKAWLAREPGANIAGVMTVTALMKLRRWDEAEKLLGGLTRLDEAAMQDLRAELAAFQGKLDDAIRAYDVLVKRGDASAANQASWLRIATGKELPRAFEDAARAAGTDKGKASANLLNTLAAVEAELGHLHAAKVDGLQAMANAGRAKPIDADWYVMGRIAEQLGLRDDAIALYRRVTPATSLFPDAHTFARRRLQALGVK